MASPPLEFLTGKIVSIIENEVSLIGGVRDQLDEIKRELLTMKAFLADAGKKGALSEVEKTWVENVRDVSIDIEDIIDEFTYQMNKQRSWGPYTRAFRQMICFPKHLWERHRIATKLHKIIRKIRAIRERNQCYGVDRIQGIGASHNYDPNRVRIYGESSLFFKDDELVGIKDAKDKLVGWLLSEQPERSVISVVGMGGSGKTTLVANTFNSQTVKKHFDCHAWITVSQTYNIEDLLKIMIKELFRAAMEAIPLDISNMSYRGLVETLIKYMQPKRYVIVLDDVWDRELWSHINVALPDGAHGSRVVLTTRNEDIASFSFGVRSHVYHVHPLIEKEAWDLFSTKAFSSWPDRSCPQELEHIARDLVGKCKGLPLGIVALGALMSTKRLKSEWTRFSSSLNWELSNNPTLEVVRSILLLSFNSLPYRLKRCFLYFCIFPEDYVVKCERLKRLWMAEGFVEQVRGATPEEIAESYIAELTCRCMLQVVQREPSGRAKTFKVHDLLRELALSISEAEKFCAVYHSQEANEGCKDSHRLSVRASNGEFQPHRDMSKVRTFFIFSPAMSDSSSLEKLPSGFKLLRVLDLKYLPLAQLPDDIVKCFNLRYLNLRSTKVKELPKDIGNLHNLETLNIKNSMIRSLPVGMVKLKNLRHLVMYHYPAYDVKSFNWLDSTQARFDISKLESLQVLDGIEAGGELIKQLRHMTQLTRLSVSNVRGVDENDLCKSIESMRLLQFLGVKTSNEDEVLRLDALATPPPLLKTLILTGKLEKVPHWFHSLDSVMHLSLHWSRLKEDFLPYIQTLPNLNKLVLHNAHVGNQLIFQTGFQKLTELSLGNFPELNTIIIENGVMPSLRTLRIGECMELKQLPDGIEHLTCLQELNFIDVPSELIERIHGEGSLDRSKVKHISDIRYCCKIELGFWAWKRL
ncbi:disease resistance protein RPM1-like [Malus sylvestris]|uniref:disease resistance protein RPM1-like n=1 Tax=Malus sylvestris TaxID=3752 RepID=UPI0021ACB0C7|nr:disease resistance protein RPM1-like [Malus sylvestris]